MTDIPSCGHATERVIRTANTPSHRARRDIHQSDRHNPEVQIMDLTRNSALDPIPDGLFVDPQDPGDVRNSQVVVHFVEP